MVRRWLWPISPAVLLGLAFLVLTRFVRRGPATPREMHVDQALIARAPASLIELSHGVDVQNWVFVVLALVVCLLVARRFRQALLLLLAEPLAEGVNLALKIAINRQFPDQSPVVGWDRFDVLLFPSGHVVRTTVTLGLVLAFVAWPHALLRWPASVAALAIVGGVGVAQVTVGGHLPLDVVGAMLLGGLLVNVVYLFDLACARRARPIAAPFVAGPGLVVERRRERQPVPSRARPLFRAIAGSAAGWPARRMLATVGLALALVICALSLRAPQRVWHLATGQTSITWTNFNPLHHVDPNR